MKIYRDIKSLSDIPDTAVALGLFDGVHLGHRAVIKAAVEQKKNGLTPAVFTFSTHQAVPSSKGKLEYICTDADRLSLFESLGIGIVFMPEFGDIKSQSAKEFVHEMLLKQFHAKFVSCGFNFHFGARGSGDTALLETECAQCGIRVGIIEPMLLEGDTISSTRIRALLADGRMEDANLLLGEPYFISGEVVHGFSIGHEIGFPTANQIIEPQRAVPKHGVYVSTAEINGKVYRSVTNIGVKPTVSGNRNPLSETHIIGYNGDLYGTSIKVKFHSFLRPETKFSGLGELKEQIRLDMQNSLSYEIK